MIRCDMHSLSRRKLLQAGTAAALGLNSAQARGPLAGRVQIAVKYQMVNEPDFTPLQKFQLLRDIGYDGVEIASFEKVDSDEIVEARKRSGLPIHGVVNAGNPEVIPAIELASKYGAETVLVFAQEDRKQSYEENFIRWQKIISEAVPAAEEKNITLCIENVRATFLKTGEEMARFIDSFETKRVRSYFDLGNTITWTEQSAEDWAAALGDRIFKLDIKDRGHPEFGDKKTARAGVTTGTNGGEVNWKAVREHLTKIQFSGWATAEVGGGDRERLTRMADWIRDVLELS